MRAADSWASSPTVRAVMQGNRGRDTRPELAVRRELFRRGLRYRVAYRPVGMRRSIDVAFTGRRLAVFIDGCFWHGCTEHYRPSRTNVAFWSSKVEANRVRDANTDAQLREAGWTVLRFWEHEAVQSVADQVEVAVRRAADDEAGRFTLDALEAEVHDRGSSPKTWPAVRFGARCNGWATPVVTRAVLASLLDLVTAHTGEPHRWDGDVALISSAVDEPEADPEHVDQLHPDANGHYDLGLLGWTFVEVEPRGAISR